LRNQINNESSKKSEYVALSKQSKLKNAIEPASDNQNEKEY
jgi:hypothetical protein